jgi:hypothetical protein
MFIVLLSRALSLNSGRIRSAIPNVGAQDSAWVACLHELL